MQHWQHWLFFSYMKKSREEFLCWLLRLLLRACLAAAFRVAIFVSAMGGYMGACGTYGLHFLVSLSGGCVLLWKFSRNGPF